MLWSSLSTAARFSVCVVMSVIDLRHIVDRMVEELLDMQTRYAICRHQAGCRATQVVRCEPREPKVLSAVADTLAQRSHGNRRSLAGFPAARCNQVFSVAKATPEMVNER
jgi:hypothetical protein